MMISEAVFFSAMLKTAECAY